MVSDDTTESFPSVTDVAVVYMQEVEVFKVKASRVDKLQVELNSQRERLEEANRTAAKLKVSPTYSHTPTTIT